MNKRVATRNKKSVRCTVNIHLQPVRQRYSPLESEIFLKDLSRLKISPFDEHPKSGTEQPDHAI